MRVNVYAEEMTQRVELVEKDGHVGIRFYLYLPVTKTLTSDTHVGPVNRTVQVQGPFEHRPGDDDSAAVTFWGKQDARKAFAQAIALLDAHYANRATGVSTAHSPPITDPTAHHLTDGLTAFSFGSGGFVSR